MARSNATIAALKRLLRDPIIPAAEMAQHFKELRSTNDRLVAVVCGSLVERTLQSLLEAVMPNGSGTLFEGNSPLSTLSAKISVAYSLNLIGPDIRRNADYIREIRNVFAHRIAPTSFATQEVAAACALLSLGKWDQSTFYQGSPRKRYLAAALETGFAITVKRGAPRGTPPASLPETRPRQRIRVHPKSHPS